MGFRCATINAKKLAENLGVDENSLVDAMKRSRNGGYARLWNFEDKGGFGSGRVSVSSKKDANSDYETQFSDGFVCFSGGAYDRAKALDIPENGVSIIILSCDVRNKYDSKSKKMFTNYYIYDFDVYDGDNGTNKSQPKNASKKKEPTTTEKDTSADDDELPF